MTVTWLIILFICLVLGKPIDTLYWLLLIPMLMQDAYDRTHK